jgi:hypothetical protein
VGAAFGVQLADAAAGYADDPDADSPQFGRNMHRVDTVYAQ